MKERSILFNSDMVNAILDGRKTQTRRPVKHHALLGFPEDWCPKKESLNKFLGDYTLFCPFGQVGDRLWCRETFGFGTQDDDINHLERIVCYKAGYPYHITDSGVNEMKRCKSGDFMQPNHYVWEPKKWTPSIHMPRWASRITLEITDVKVQRIQKITKEEAKAEGVTKTDFPLETVEGWADDLYPRFFREKWQNIYNTWNSNPWVWAITFKKVK